MSWMKRLFGMALALGLSTLCAKDLYVAPGGSDAVTYEQNGLGSPWATPGRAWAEAHAGDTVYFRGGTYVLTATVDTQTMGFHGTAAEPITFTSYPGEVATIDCAQVWVGFGIQKNHNTIRNLHFINYAVCFSIGYQVSGDYTEILDCTGIANRQGGADNVGFVVSRNREAHIRVQNNRIIGPGKDLNPNTAGVLVFGCRQLKVLNNEFSDLPMGIFYKHPNLVAAQAETDIEFAFNYFTNCGNAIPTAACYAHIHDNVSGVGGGSISSGLDGGLPEGTSFGDYCIIEHNTIYAPALLVEGSPGIGFSYSERGYDANGQPYDPFRGATHNQIRNNILMANHRAHAYGPPRDINGNPIANYDYANSYDYNMYHGRSYANGIGHPSNYAIAVQDGVSYTTLAAWRAKNGGDQHSIAANPIFVEGETPSTIAGFALAAGSPGKNAAADGRDMGADVTKVGIQPQAPSSVLWRDDFEETSALTSRYEDVSSNGFAVGTADAFNGTRALRQTYQVGQVDAGWVVKKPSAGFPDRLFMRWYHKFEAGFQGFPPKMARIRQRRVDWSSPMEVHCWLDTSAQYGGTVVLDVKAEHSSQQNGSGWLSVLRTDFTFANPANIGRWVCFEMEVQLNTPGQANGHYRLWIDDVLKAERTGVDLRGSQTYGINEAMLDCYWNGGAPRVQSRSYDAFVIATQKIGPEPGGTLTVTSPNGGEAWQRNETRAITWTATGVSENLTIELMQGPTLLGVIATGIAPASGSFTWTVGRLADGAFITGTNLKIRIRTASGRVMAEGHWSKQ